MGGRMNQSTPVELGFTWIAEWEHHEATWISWPHNQSTWPDRFHAIPPVTEQIIRTLAEVEHVHVLGGPETSLRSARQTLQTIPNVTVHPIATNDVWIRDYGPTFLVNRKTKKLGAVQWIFNAWGNKYHPHDSDANASTEICKGLDAQGVWHEPEDDQTSSDPIRAFRSKLVCEGGALETDGEGTLLTTSSAVYTATRNPNWSRRDIEQEFMRMLGIRKVLWVDGGELAGDDTDSHIDQLVRFTRPGVVLAAISSTSDDSNAPHLANQFQALNAMTDAQGRELEIVPLPTPPPRMVQGHRVPESYCNFYLANGIVIVPQFGYRATDDAALGILREHYPNRDIVPVDASDFIWGLGAFHCATQQQPAVVERK
jgi:agmatine deiminase